MSFFIFIKNKTTFVKCCPNATRSNISFSQERSKKRGFSQFCEKVFLTLVHCWEEVIKVGGYVMKDVVLDEVVKGLSEKYNKKEKIVAQMLEKCQKLEYNFEESKKLIYDFYN